MYLKRWWSETAFNSWQWRLGYWVLHMQMLSAEPILKPWRCKTVANSNCPGMKYSDNWFSFPLSFVMDGSSFLGLSVCFLLEIHKEHFSLEFKCYFFVVVRRWDSMKNKMKSYLTSAKWRLPIVIGREHENGKGGERNFLSFSLRSQLPWASTTWGGEGRVN